MNATPSKKKKEYRRYMVYTLILLKPAILSPSLNTILFIPLKKLKRIARLTGNQIGSSHATNLQ
jgi:hypothetical protein